MSPPPELGLNMPNGAPVLFQSVTKLQVYSICQTSVKFYFIAVSRIKRHLAVGLFPDPHSLEELIHPDRILRIVRIWERE